MSARAFTFDQFVDVRFYSWTACQQCGFFHQYDWVIFWGNNNLRNHVH